MTARLDRRLPAPRAVQLRSSPRAARVSLPIGRDEVRAIASAGFPLKEPLGVMALRNKRITVAYADLGAQLMRLIASRSPEVLVGNWCTFAAWSSRTIGSSIDPDDLPDRLRDSPDLPLRSRASRIAQRLVGSELDPAIRSLAAGNRFIFLEIGTVVAEFVRTFGAPACLGLCLAELEPHWDRYWAEMERVLGELNRLDPSWVLTGVGSSEPLRAGMRQYLEALTECDADRKSERVLAANILLAAYEQYRADGYVYTSLSPRAGAAFRRLLVHGTGRSRGPLRRLVDRMYAGAITRRALSLLTPYEVIRIGKELRPPMGHDGTRRSSLFATDVLDLELPLLQALVSRFDVADDGRPRRGARNWLDYHERMHFIVSFFRAHHTDESCWTEPLFDAEVVSTLLGGSLPTRS